VYGSEAILPADIAFQAPRLRILMKNSRLRLEEERLVTCVRMSKYLEGLRRYYNRNNQE
jgi:hypothetical protein